MIATATKAKGPTPFSVEAWTVFVREDNRLDRQLAGLLAHAGSDPKKREEAALNHYIGTLPDPKVLAQWEAFSADWAVRPVKRTAVTFLHNMTTRGWVLVETGGNQTEWQKRPKHPLSPVARLAITDDGQAPEALDQGCAVVAYDLERAALGSVCFHQLSDFLALFDKEEEEDIMAYIVNGSGEWHPEGVY